MLICPNCGAQNADGANNCSNCGVAFVTAYQPIYTKEEPVNGGKGFAISAMVLGILSMFCFVFPFILSPLAIIFGAVAKGKGNKSGMATTGIVLGIVSYEIRPVVYCICRLTSLE